MYRLIRFRLVYNRKHQLNRNGQALVQVECLQDGKRMYLSTNVYLRPEDWDGVKVVNHPLASQINKYLFDRLIELQRIEFEFLQRGKEPTLRTLHDALTYHATPSARLKDFMHAVIDNDSSRCKTTRRSYTYLVRDMEKEFGSLTVEEVNYDIIIRYRESMRKKGLSENTVKGRLKSLRSLLHQAHIRDVIPSNPFDKIQIGNMTARREHLTETELRRISRICLEGREAHIRDAFVFCCMTGLRYSDFTNMRTENIRNNILTLEQQKTRGMVKIPLASLFHGRPLEIMGRYGSVEEFADIGHNSTVNKALKEIAKKAGIKKRIFYHISRHTAATLLNLYGLQMQEIQQILGHARLETTSSHYAETTTKQLEKSLKKAFKVTNG